MFANLRTIVVDELHGFAKEKRGDLLSLSMARLHKLAPRLRRVGLSATISDPDAYRSWLAPDADMELVDLVLGEPGADPDLSILIPENRIPWAGHSGRHAAREVMELIEQHKTTLVFCNTRSLAELIFQDLWAVNDNALPIGIHHGSLAVEARRKVENGDGRGQAARAGRDRQPRPWHRLGRRRPGRADGRAEGHRRACCSGSAAPITGSTSRARASSCPATASNISKPRAALDAIGDGELDPETFRPGALDVLAQHILAVAVLRSRSSRTRCSPKSAPPRLMPGCKAETFDGGPELHRHRRLRAQGLRPVPPAGSGGRRQSGASPRRRSPSSTGSMPA